MHDQEKLSWRDIARRPEFQGISFATLDAIYHGREPKKLSVRIRLGWPILSTVVVISGAIPDGTQAYNAQRCPCGQWFIPNHPCRRKCFICSPYRGRKNGRV